MSNRHSVLVPNAQSELDKLKMEVSSELGVEVPHATPTGRWGYVPAQRCGDIGGNMVKKMVESFEKGLIK